MEKNNPLYKNQGIHAITSIFTVEKGIVKVLLIKRKQEPFCGMWALVGGAIYNNEDLVDGLLREINEKTGITDIEVYFSGVFGKKDRSPVIRMLATSFVGIIDSKRVKILKETINTSNAEWIDIKNINTLAYDHNEILDHALETLKELINTTDILKSLFPDGFTLPELQKTFETITGETYDRRNFRKKFIANNLIKATNKTKTFGGNKPAIVYKFNKIKTAKNVF